MIYAHFYAIFGGELQMTIILHRGERPNDYNITGGGRFRFVNFVFGQRLVGTIASAKAAFESKSRSKN